jgi:hypothetical protein
MLDKSRNQMAQARNFLRILRQIREAGALGLLDGSEPTVDVRLALRVQSFARFLLEKLHHEMVALASGSSAALVYEGSPYASGRPDVSLMDMLFGWQLETRTRYALVSNWLKV